MVMKIVRKTKKGKKIRMKIRGFEICNHYMDSDDLKIGYYNHELMNLFIKSILLIDLDKRKYKNDEVTLNLIEYKQSSNNVNLMEGVFTTARHGVSKKTINVETQEEMNKIESFEGVKNEIQFTLHKITGLLLVEEDKQNHVFTRPLLKSFFYKHRNLIYPYVDEFNTKNKSEKVIIYKSRIFTIASLPPINFFEKVSEFKSIKNGVIYINTSETPKGEVDVIKKLEDELEEHKIEDYDLEIKIKNKSPRGMVKVFEKYFEGMINAQKYDFFAIEGVTKSGATKKINPDTITRDFDIEVEINGNGIRVLDDIHRGMEEIVENENPLSANRKINQSFLIKDDTNVWSKIEEISNSINQSEKSEEEITESQRAE
ncbi:hypothetical protein [Viridibacillus sp. FSL H8-0110]|uniref:hypothetical protein n=1 Tax=Viridibacillus sp. FSL H8-0110 TaxID=2921376 RepID=UPI0030FB3BD2